MYVTLRAGDTVSSLAQEYLGSDAMAQAIVSANALDPPYITDDASFVTSAAASGTVTFTLTGSSSVTLAVGTVVSTSAGPSGEVRSYATTTAVVLNSTGNSGSTAATCTLNGPLGNVAPGRVSVVSVSGVDVTNSGPMTGGYTLHVLRPGDSLWIPQPSLILAPSLKTTARVSLLRADEDGGTGVLVTPTGGLSWDVDDLAQATGADEIGLEIANRLRTQSGRLFYNPGVGSLLPALRGSTATDALAQAVVLAQADALQDPRIEAASFTAQPYADGWILLNGTLKLKTGPEIQRSIVLG